MRRCGSLYTVLFLFVFCAAAQDDALQLLKEVAANHAGLWKSTYDFEQVEVREYLGSITNRTTTVTRLAGSRGRTRQERLPNGILHLFDGQQRWTYNPDRNEYTKQSAPPIVVSDTTAIGRFERPDGPYRSARFLRQEAVELASDLVMCQVIEAEPEPSDSHIVYGPIAMWIDVGRKLIVKQHFRMTIHSPDRPPSKTVMTVSLRKAEIGVPLEEALFRFTPPEGAEQVEQMRFVPKSPQLGKLAPEFELAAADGTPLSLTALRGKAVLLRFGITPAGDSLLLLEMLHRALGEKGLAVYVVQPPRNRRTSAHQGYTVPVASDTHGAAAKQFGISFSGTVLIDRQGKIAYLGSMGSPDLLAEALQKIGVW